MEDKKILGAIRRCIVDFNLIEDGDKICVGLSGGKDSLCLLYALAKMRKFMPNHYEVVAVMVDLGLKDTDKNQLEKIKKLVLEWNVELHIVQTDIAEIIFDIRKESNPCSLCANMRRGALNSKALELNCNKIALAHSEDDFVETFVLSLLYEGRLNAMQPSTYLSKSDLTVIRPMLYMDEQAVIAFTKEMPILHNPCPANKKTQRQYVKEVIDRLDKETRGAKKLMKRAIFNVEGYNLLEPYEKKRKPRGGVLRADKD